MQPKQLQPCNQIKEAIVQVVEICDLIWKKTKLSQLVFQEILILSIEATMVISC